MQVNYPRHSVAECCRTSPAGGQCNDTGEPDVMAAWQHEFSVLIYRGPGIDDAKHDMERSISHGIGQLSSHYEVPQSKVLSSNSW